METRRRSGLAWVAVAALHGLLLAALIVGSRNNTPPDPVARRLMRVDLIAAAPNEHRARSGPVRSGRTAAPVRHDAADRNDADDRPHGDAPVPATDGGTTVAGAPRPGAARAPLDLSLPAASIARGRAPTMLEQMRSDPRTNSPRLTQSERFAVALGAIDCVLEERQPDGTIVRMNGRRVPMQSLYRGATGQTDAVMVCVK